ncbi:MAG: hypothetical protein LBD77_04895 [Bifidobacteriaceae bacterium]|nr:hypothetical protein [Bifidobacteriaceae bacterium]
MVSSAASSGAPAEGCYLQALVDTGGLVAVPAGCQEDGPITVSGKVELAGGPVTVAGGFVVADGANLTVVDDTAIVGPVTVASGGTLALVGSGASADGAIWVQPGAQATFMGVGPAGVTGTDLINQGWTVASGLVRLGQQGRGLTTGVGGAGELSLGQLAVGSELWFDPPRSEVAVARLIEGSLGAAGTGAIQCDDAACEVGTTISSAGEVWITLTPGSPGVDPDPDPTEDPTEEPTPGAPSDLGALIAQAGDGGVVQVPAGLGAGDGVLTVADAAGGGIDVTLTGGPLVRASAGTMIRVPAGSTLTLSQITVDGAWDGATQAYAPVVEVAAGGRLVLATGSQISSNQSFGVVNSGILDMVGANAAITDCVVDADGLTGLVGPLGGAGVWNRAGGVFWMSGGLIGRNTVEATSDGAYGGGVLNAGSMRLAGGSINANQVDGGGGGVAVVREPGSDYGGRLDVGAYYTTVSGAERPALTENSASFGGGLAVVDSAAWGGNPTELPAAQVPADVPSAVFEHGVIGANEASGAGGAVMAMGGSAVGLEGPVKVSASNQAGTPGSAGVAVADAYLRVAGDVLTEAGGGIALLKQGWPVVLTNSFTGAGSLVVEAVDGLTAENAWQAARVADPASPLTDDALVAIEFALAGLEVSLENGKDGQLVLRASAAAASTPPNNPLEPTEPPVAEPPAQQPTPTRSAAPTAVPTAGPSSAATPTPTPTNRGNSPSPTQSATDQGRSPDAVSRPSQSAASGESAEDPGDDSTAEDSDAAQGTETSPSPTSTRPSSTQASSGASASASASASAGGGGSAGGEGGGGSNLSLPEPPAGASSRTIGFGLMAIGVFGLAGLGIYVMRRGGFFAA